MEFELGRAVTVEQGKGEGKILHEGRTACGRHGSMRDQRIFGELYVFRISGTQSRRRRAHLACTGS